MHPLMEQAEKIMRFIGEAIGPHCEVVLQDVEQQKIVAIVNSHISGRKVGSPLTDFALNIIASESWKRSDCVTQYKGVLPNGRTLKSSTYFIKDGSALLGMLCVNIDITSFIALDDQIRRICGITPEAEQIADRCIPILSETFPKSISDIVSDTIVEKLGSAVDSSRMRQEEKISVVRVLNAKGVFRLKSAISEVSKSLSCSEATVYRYLSKIEKQDKQPQ